MNKSLYVGLAIACSSLSVHAQAGHNGINFTTTQKQLEAKGFVCNPPEKKQDYITAECVHMDMTGIAFGYPTKDYEISIDPLKRVAWIKAELTGLRSMADFFELHGKIEKFFPSKDEQGTHRGQGHYTRDAWRAKNNAGLSLFFSQGIPPLTKTRMSVTFYSPNSMADTDKIRAEGK